jgi:ketosteroid isomerase-like protein
MAAKEAPQKMTTKEIADTLVKLCSQGKFDEATDQLYSPDIVSVEAGAPPGQSRESKGIQAVKTKGEWWVANHDVHSVKVEGPLVTPSHFAVTFKLDVTFKPEKRRFQMEEIALYKVADGKIVYEEFFYNM